MGTKKVFLPGLGATGFVVKLQTVPVVVPWLLTESIRQ